MAETNSHENRLAGHEDLQFKFIKKQDGSVTWEGSSNRSLMVPSSDSNFYAGNWQR